LAGIVRPYAQRIAGEPLRMTFDLERQMFELKYRVDPAMIAPTEIFVPELQYPDGVTIELTDGRYKYDRAAQMIEVWHTPNQTTQTVRIKPA
jgi:hypothetical protein